MTTDNSQISDNGIKCGISLLEVIPYLVRRGTDNVYHMKSFSNDLQQRSQSKYGRKCKPENENILIRKTNVSFTCNNHRKRFKSVR